MQFTTATEEWRYLFPLFQRAKIQDYRCNSQQEVLTGADNAGCFKEQRYKIIDAIHNYDDDASFLRSVVSKSKDTRL